MKGVNITVWGRVQGVGFRYFVYNYARNIGIVGWVKNNPDRSVTVCAEGSEPQIDMIVEAVKKGPSHAQVEKVKLQYYNSTGKYNEFNITG